MEHVIRNRKERVWLVEYPPGHAYAILKYAWTLEWANATCYPNKEAAEKRIAELEVTELCYPESTDLKTKKI